MLIDNLVAYVNNKKSKIISLSILKAGVVGIYTAKDIGRRHAGHYTIKHVEDQLHFRRLEQVTRTRNMSIKLSE